MPFVLISPLMNAVCAWLCVSLLIYALFKPEKPFHLLGLRLQGVVPASFHKLSQQLADLIYQQLISHKDRLKAEITSEQKVEQLMPYIEEHIEYFLKEKLPQSMPMIAMLIGDKTIGQIKEVFVGEIKVLFPKLIAQYADHLLEDERLYPLLTSQLQSAAAYSYILGLREKGRGLFMKIKLGAFVFGLLFGLIMAIFY